jgi:DNA-binding GntR family transcriptional regulator
VRELSGSAAAIADRLREELLSGALLPGQRLKEEELAERFRVGRYTVRSALRTLVDARLLVHETNRGAEVPTLHSERVDELYEYRTILEVGSLRSVQAHGRSLKAIEDATAVLVSLPTDAAWPVVIGRHQEIHRAIVAASGNVRLIAAYRLCEEELQFVIATTRPAYSASRLAALHIDLLEKLHAGGDGALAALARDIEVGRRAVHDAMEPHL